METYEKHEGLVIWLGNKVMVGWQLNEQEREDILQEGRIALLGVLEKYNSREDLQKYKFSTIAHWPVKTAMQRYADRFIHRHKNTASLNELVGEDGGAEVVDFLEDEDADTYRTVEQRIESHRVRVALAELVDEEELKLLYRHHAFRVTLDQIGGPLGVTGETIRLRILDILKKIRKSRWYREEMRAKMDRETSFLRGSSPRYKPEQMQRAGSPYSSVENIVLGRERRAEAFRARIDSRDARNELRFQELLAQEMERERRWAEMT